MASEENRPVTPSSEEPEETVVQDAEHSAGEAAVQEAAAEIAEDTAELTEDTAETAETVEEAAEETENEETAAEAPEEPNAEASEEPETAPAETPKKGLSKGARISIIIAAVVLVLGALAAGVFWFLSAHPELTAKKVETAYGDQAYLAENTAFGTSALTDRDRYDITDTTADSLEMRTAIARDENGDYFMTNGELQVAYWMEFYQMMQNYGSYISMMGLDTTRPLHEQSSLLEGNTWEQYFLTSVVKKTSQFRALERAAQADGYELPEDVATQLDDLTNPEGDLAKEAADAGFESIDAYLQENFGAGVTAKDYQNYMRMYITAMHYYQDVLYGEPYANATDAEVEAYYDANAETYAEKGTLKVNNINVRHILIQPEGEKGTDGTYSEDAWAAAEAEANRIYALWQENQTEDNFSELAKTYSKDSNASDGGIYEALAPGKTVTEFNDWCFDANRKAGDTGIVRTTYGYHIMYFCGTADTRAWFDTAKEDMAAELANEKINELCETYVEEFDYSNMWVFDLVSYANSQKDTDASQTTDAGESTDASESADASEDTAGSTQAPEAAG